ncbi:rhomboid family intramembrane serine protease [bacterium]|nr:rhomboid family intramembrane serine protease [bacterium]
MRDTWTQITGFLSRFLSPGVMGIFLVNVLVFIVFLLTTPFSKTAGTFFFELAQTPDLAVGKLHLWQFLTYMFLHFETFHLLINMLVLWFFAPRLEYRWGTKPFLLFYLVTGIGAGLFHTFLGYSTGHADAALIGASGAIYGVMLAYALAWPNDTVLLYFVVPIKVKYLMMFLGVVAFLGSATETQGGISHVTHLGGLVVAFVYLTIWKKMKGGGLSGPEQYRGYYR